MIHVRHLGRKPYETVWEAMKTFTAERDKKTTDELWLVEHPPVYTQGQAGKAEHILNPGSIPIVQTDRGGQVTYHGPGQMVAYILMDIERRNLGVRTLVCYLERTLIQLLKRYNILAHPQEGAPGVYVDSKKIASIGLRVKKGCTYHGVALNVNMDLSPFRGINPCGFSSMEMTQLCAFFPNANLAQIQSLFAQEFLTLFKD